MSVRIAVLDTGVTEEYRQYLSAAVAVEGDTIGSQSELSPAAYAHGTNCLAIIRKYMETAQLSSVRILDDMGRGTVDKLAPAFAWCVRQGIDIVNLSFGTTNFKDREYLLELVEEYTAQGLVIVAASANSGYTTYPASFSSVIGVESLRASAARGKDGFASWCLQSKNIHTGVDILAPSVHQVDIGGRMRRTPQSNSYAAPYVTAWAGKILEQNPNFHPGQLVNKMRSQLPEGLPPSVEPEEGEIPMVLLSVTEKEEGAEIIDGLCRLFQEDDYHAYGLLIDGTQIFCGRESCRMDISGNKYSAQIDKFLKNEIYYKRVDILIAAVKRENSVTMKKWKQYADIFIKWDREREKTRQTVKSYYRKILGQLLGRDSRGMPAGGREEEDE